MSRRLLLLPVLLSLASCTLSLPSPTSTAAPAATVLVATGAVLGLDGTSWLLQSYIDLKGNSLDVLPGSQVELTFQNGQLVGLSGCNSYFGSYQVQDDLLAFSRFDHTEKFCTSPGGLMDQEAQYLQTLGTVRSFKLVDGRLQLLDLGGQTVLTYIPLAP